MKIPSQLLKTIGKQPNVAPNVAVFAVTLIMLAAAGGLAWGLWIMFGPQQNIAVPYIPAGCEACGMG